MQKQRYGLHALLFVLTLFTTTIAGTGWMTGRFVFDLPWNEIWQGFWFSIPFLGILSVHEFGHYFLCRFHKIKASLPYFIPFWLGSFSIGTMGAFIRIRTMPKTRKQFFDVGVAGPLAGFVVALVVLTYGFTHLPAREDIFRIHPEYKRYGLSYEKYVYTAKFIQEEDSLGFVAAQAQGIVPKTDDKGVASKFIARPEVYKEIMEGNFSLGNNLLLHFFRNYVAESPDMVPNPYEFMHYPLLFAGYLALFFTALNLLPIGQLDGGHILYGLIGYENHRRVSPVLFVVYIFYAGLGVVQPNGAVSFIGSELEIFVGIPLYLLYLYLVFDKMTDNLRDTLLLSVGVLAAQWLVTVYFGVRGYQAWLVFGFIVGRFLGVYHPPALYEEPLDWRRKVLGWLALVVFVLCFTPEPFRFGV